MVYDITQVRTVGLQGLHVESACLSQMIRGGARHLHHEVRIEPQSESSRIEIAPGECQLALWSNSYGWKHTSC